MRTYGRVAASLADPEPTKWVEVQTEPSGLNDYVYVTALVQELKLNLGESPFWGDRGIPAKPSVVTQVAPDYYTMLMQQRYAPYFLALTIVRGVDKYAGRGMYRPEYRIDITTHYGVQLNLSIPV
jgi:hypothetical protein